jgi:hypothetical protein
MGRDERTAGRVSIRRNEVDESTHKAEPDVLRTATGVTGPPGTGVPAPRQ